MANIDGDLVTSIPGIIVFNWADFGQPESFFNAMDKTCLEYDVSDDRARMCEIFGVKDLRDMPYCLTAIGYCHDGDIGAIQFSTRRNCVCIFDPTSNPEFADNPDFAYIVALYDGESDFGGSPINYQFITTFKGAVLKALQWCEQTLQVFDRFTYELELQRLTRKYDLSVLEEKFCIEAAQIPKDYIQSAAGLDSIFREFVRPCGEAQYVWKLLHHNDMRRKIEALQEHEDDSSKYAGLSIRSIKSLMLMAKNSEQTLDEFLEDNDEVDSSSIITALISKLEMQE